MAKPNTESQLMEKLVSLCKRRGFVFQSSEIYGGLNGAWDYGPLGVELLRNIKDAWWKSMTYRSNIEGIDAAILMHPRTWEASGHVENFTDPMVDCKQCKSRYRLDILAEMIAKKARAKILDKTISIIKEESSIDDLDRKFTNALINKCRNLDYNFFAGTKLSQVYERINDYVKNPENETKYLNEVISDPDFFQYLKMLITCPNCGNADTFTEARKFNLMFKTFVGPVEDSSNVVYLRPETAQGIFVNFLNVQAASRQKLPFGIAQIGKAFRNEINTKNFLFRTREFEQMEMQFFCKPGTDDQHFEYWREQRMNWFLSLGMPKEKLQWHQHEPNKLAHYAKNAYDIEFKFPVRLG